ncbi:MAG: bifunctional 3'-5' exonuclease/DNA polymerase, partial [Blastocatellia bacterium]|nr:bifunctional 3'-5' exonuclease/DNA polymerase [Blastocatellia bacterium]
MEIYFQLINDAEGVANACRELSGEKYLGFDTETTELDPYRGDLRLVQFSTGKSTYVVDMQPFGSNGSLRENPALAPLRDLLADGTQIKIAHNAKFDAKWVRYHLGAELNGVFDTFLASQLIAAGDSDRRHSLADVAQFFTGTEVDKTEQVSDWSRELSQSQIEYAARDAAIMVPLREQIAERLKTDDLERVANLEFDCVMPIAEMEVNGFYLDEARWREQLGRVTVAQAKAADELQELLSAGVAQASLFGRAEINLDSQQQVTDALLNLGVPVPDTTRAWQLQPLAEKYPVVAKLLEYRGVAKSMSSFGENILEFIEPKTGRIHADFRQIGAPTGRFSCSNPNLQQIPHERQYRRCFKAPEGKSLIIADYSQIELRILAEFSGDTNFIKAFVSGEDFHSITASQVFGVAAADVTSEQRSFAKRLNFGVVYGIGASR